MKTLLCVLLLTSVSYAEIPECPGQYLSAYWSAEALPPRRRTIYFVYSEFSPRSMFYKRLLSTKDYSTIINKELRNTPQAKTLTAKAPRFLQLGPKPRDTL